MSDKKIDVDVSRDGRFEGELYPWLTNDVAHFLELIGDEKFPHALVVHGSAGYGKRMLALSIAGVLLCAKAERHVRCGTCKSCQLIDAGMHPDLSIVGSAGGRSIVIATIRQLQSSLLQTSQQGGRKVCVIVGAETMNDNAANALLKLLEEPPDGTYFLLVSDRPARLPKTIVSRCVRHAIVRPTNEQLTAWLLAQSPTTAKRDIHRVLAVSRGNPDRARDLLSGGVEASLTEQQFVQWLAGQQSSKDLLSSAAQDDPCGFARQLSCLLHATTTALLPGSQQQPATGLRAICELPQLVAMHARVLWYLPQLELGGGGVQMQLQLESLLADCMQIVQNPHSELCYPALS